MAEVWSIETLLLLTILSFTIFRLVYGAFYRLYLSPLAKFPGPKLAALTLWYEFYYDVIKGGKYTWVIAKMHEKYGPIVRINPYEIHINDPEYIDEVYPGPSRRTMKWEWSAKMFQCGSAALSTLGHELHRQRRAATAPFFSKASIQRLEPSVQSVVDKLVLRLGALQGSGTLIILINLFSALTADIIFEYSFARSPNFLDSPDFAPEWHYMMKRASINTHITKQFGWIARGTQNLPLWAVKAFFPQFLPLLAMKKGLYNQVIEIKNKIQNNQKPEGQTTILYDVLTNDRVRPEEKTVDHLAGEAHILVAAGTVTTAHILEVLTFHVVNNPDILEKLRAELATIMTETQPPPELRQLELLPYLTAVITEALRIGYGASHRLQRISPDVALQYKEWTIPAGTPVSMTAVLIHDNPTLFPNPRTFSPDRWLQTSGSRLQKYLMTFSRGTRQCTGMNLAYAELYLTAAALFAPGRFDLTLFETTIEDVETVHDFFNPFPRQDSKGIRILIN